MSILKNALSVIVLSVFLTFASALASYQPKAYYGALFEPNDKILHGAGQTYSSEPQNSAFEIYAELLGNDAFPVIFMDYNTMNSSMGFYTSLKDRLDAIEQQYGKFVVPQIGLYIPEEGMPVGQYDTELQRLSDGLMLLERPVFLRIGYEFNGTWYNPMYQPASYKAAFIRITEKLRNDDVPAATVWCAYPGYSSYYGAWSYLEDFYPGDQYVDWWGIDIFSASDITAATTQDFVDQAAIHQKPVMIGEATPRYIGADDSADWNAWFVPFFDLIKNNSGIKAHTYINWDWDGTAWPTWGDAKLETGDSTVRANYINELNDPIYEHAQGQPPEWAFGTCSLVRAYGYTQASDINGDCRVDFKDFAALMLNWLNCNDPDNPSLGMPSGCVITWQELLQ